MHSEILTSAQMNTDQNLVKMAKILSELETLLERSLGKKLRSPPKNAWLRFLKLEESSQTQAILGLERQLHFLQGALDQGIEGVNESAMLRFALDKFYLIGEGDLTQDIRSCDVVEIFDDELRQIYRSFSCFSLSNYSLLELTTYPWFELYERSHSIEGILMDSCQHIIQGKFSQLDMEDRLPPYTLREILTDERAVFSMKEKFLKRLSSTNTKKHFCLSVKEVKEVSSDTKDQFIRYL
jgi:hypothetical protein